MSRDFSSRKSPIGVFDSGFGGLTILKEIRKVLPQYDYLFLGDNARAPYGSRSFDIVYRFTLEAVKYLFAQGCELVILACNTASAKALRTIQQNDLPRIDPQRRVLGVIRPTAEVIGTLSASGHIGIFATPGTIQSQSYDIEISKLHNGFKTFGHACPMWVPLIENKESDGEGADYFVKKDIEQLISLDSDIDTVILGCTHYPLLLSKIKKYMPQGINVVQQGPIVAASLADYLQRHSEMEMRLSKGGGCKYLTTESAEKFGGLASIFLGEEITPKHIDL
ncbi:MAG: glutamate racemase [Muribaculaceae bacterium]